MLIILNSHQVGVVENNTHCKKMKVQTPNFIIHLIYCKYQEIVQNITICNCACIFG